MLPLLLALLSAPHPAHPAARAAASPWGYDAHRLICDVAWREMNPVARAAVQRILAGARPHERFSESCIWADEIRNDPAYARYVTAHYTNIPSGRERVDPAVDCAESYCVIEAIRDLTAEVADRALPAAQRRDALRFLVHFVGDIHQPLHVGRPEDRGGNDVHLRFLDELTNLHTLWDAGLVQRALLDPWDGRRLYESIAPAERAAWGDLDPVTWANESYRIVEREAYRGVEPGAALGNVYADRNAAIVERRIVQAGYRLGRLLNQLLGPRPSRGVTPPRPDPRATRRAGFGRPPARRHRARAAGSPGLAPPRVSTSRAPGARPRPTSAP
ncbi:MAG TPA: S1/P1 nuclease [Gemmatimonadales bacterium]